jgi:rRNA processing protein Krr1/Pno1
MSISKENQDKLIKVMKEIYKIEGSEATDCRMLSVNDLYSISTYNTDIDSTLKFSIVVDEEDGEVEIKDWINEDEIKDFIEYMDYFDLIFDTFDVDTIKFSDGHYRYKFTKEDMAIEVFICNAVHKGGYDRIQAMLDRIYEIGVKEVFLSENIDTN